MASAALNYLSAGTGEYTVGDPREGIDGYFVPHPARSVLSLAFAAAVVCHCMLDGASAPPQASGFTWSTT